MKNKVVSLGVHILDVLGRPVMQIPPGQNLALLEEIRVTVAGTAAGTSVDMAKLGMQVTAMGALGQDEIGHMVVSTMQRYGIDTDSLVRKLGVQTSATMLTAMTSTILSRRACALTGSAITSRSRRNSIRGPASAPRIGPIPLTETKQ